MVSRIIAVEPFDLVVFGATGDLSHRKLIPALFSRDRQGQLPPDARIIGASRKPMTNAAFRDFARQALKDHAKLSEADASTIETFVARLSYVTVDAASESGWGDLENALGKAGDRIRIFYLATGPDLFGPICARLGAHGMAGANARVVVEKPIGKDLASADRKSVV